MGRGDKKTVEMTGALLRPAFVPRHLFSRTLLKEAANLVPCQLGMVWVPRPRVVLGICAGQAVRTLLKENGQAGVAFFERTVLTKRAIAAAWLCKPEHPSQ